MSKKSADKLLEYERGYWNQNKLVLGVDEAGYGCFAGSMFIAGVCFDPFSIVPKELLKVKDSKKLDLETRFKLEPEIKASAKAWFVIEVSAEEINASDNVYWLRFTSVENKIMKEYKDLVSGNIVSYDGNKALRLSGLDCISECLVKGDSNSFSIAAASILAKSAKDREMLEKDKLYPEYGFALNKGYYSEEHGKAIKKYGMSVEHRHKYCQRYV